MHLSLKARTALLHIYNAIITLQYTPRLWRNADIIFLPKPGKDNYTQCRSFRPISLMPFLLKTLERMVQWRMEEQSTPFHRDQHAFQKGHCTENALSHLVDTAEKAILRQNVALAVFLDTKGAFDNLTTESIEDGMNSHGAEEELTGWFCNYLNGRYCQVKCNKQYFRLRKGMGQGGVLSPSIWNFVMDSFLNTFTDHEADAIAYADDGALIIVATNIESAELHMQNAINKAHTWATDHGLEFSIPKTKAIILSRRRNPLTLTVPLTMNGHDIGVVPVFKYLGVTLDSKLY
jgi:hypothetical protein